MKKIKILFVIDKMNVGGAQKHLIELLKRLKKQHFDPAVCCLEYPGELKNEVDSLGVSLFALGIKRIYDFSGITGLLKLKRYIRKEKIDIVHSYLFSANVVATIAAKLAGAPLIITGRRDTGIHREGKWRHHFIYRCMYHYADAVFAVSNAVRDVVHRDEGVPLGKIITIYNGIAPETMSVAIDIKTKKKELGIPLEDKVVGMIANLNWVKGHQVFINSAKLILQEMPATTFLIIGDGPLRLALIQSVHQQQLGKKILFLGRRKDIPELLNIMDVSVNTSFSEGMSNTILESMASGVSVVATDVDGNKEVVSDTHTGFLVAPADAKALKEKIVFLLRNRSLAVAMGHAGQERVKEKFSLSVMAERYEQVYTQLLQGKYNGRYSN